MTRLMMRTVLLAIALSFVSANAWAVPDIWRWWNLPQVAFGGGYTSTLIIRDSLGLPARDIWVYFYDDNGNALNANVGGVGNQISYFNFSLGPNQEYSYALTSTGSTVAGSVQIASAGIGDLNVSLRYTVTDSHSNVTDVIGVLPAEPNFNWTATVQKNSSSDLTGVAIANPYNSSFTVSFDFYQNGTRVPGTTTKTLTLAALGHQAMFLNDSKLVGVTAWSNFSGTGTLRISSSASPFAALVLRADGTQYSSLPTEAGAQQWTCTYTDLRIGAQTATWNWRSYDGYTFVGYEQDSWNTDKVRIRGTFASDIGDFLAEWTYKNNYQNDQSSGQTVFMGKIQTGGNTITGHRIEIQQDGTIATNVTFTATRVY